MTTPARILYRAAGFPALPNSKGAKVQHDGFCYWCGLPCDEVGAFELKSAASASFTDQEAVAYPSATHQCAACCWIMTGNPPATYRMWTALWREDWAGKEPGDLPRWLIEKDRHDEQQSRLRRGSNHATIN